MHNVIFIKYIPLFNKNVKYVNYTVIEHRRNHDHSNSSL